MKILHTTPKGLPDWRIEREAYLARKAGHRVELLGMGPKKTPFLDVFDNVTMVREINTRQAALDKSIRKEWAEVVESISPDLIHANDIIAAKFSTGLGFPMVYDDHEYWSAQLINYQSWPLWKRIAIRPFLKVVPEWEHEILSHHVTITVSEAIAEEHRRICDHVFLLRNLNLSEEVNGLSINPKREGIAYVGADYKLKKFAPHRDMTGLTDVISFDALSGLPRDVLFKNLTKYRFGLLPFRTTPYTKYISSTKTFDYLNCGLQVLMTRQLYESHGCLPYTYPFDDYSELPSLIDEIEIVNPKEIMSYANKELVWEAQQDQLFKAYEIAIETFK
ncbi:MAG: hypothetical protein ACFFD8_05930 [Candidatus Thorarchaeota archaeon]